LKEASEHNIKTEIKHTRNGKGLFTKNRIMKDAVLFTVTGKTVRVSYDDDIEEDRWFGIDRETWIIVYSKNPMYYMNHSCNPNCAIVNRTQVITLREIEVDEELTFDYSTTEEDPYWEMPCNCGYEFCRKLITPTAKFTLDKTSNEILSTKNLELKYIKMN